MKLRDFNCGFKAYRREAIQDLNLYGEMHRFIPVLLARRGFAIGELAVKHHPRQFGKSKYGLERLLKGCFDLFTVLLNTRYFTRPMHLFGFVGLCSGSIGFAILTYLSVLWFMGLGPIGNRPLLVLGYLLLMVGVQLVGIGLIGELIVRNRFVEKSYDVVERPRGMDANRDE